MKLLLKIMKMKMFHKILVKTPHKIKQKQFRMNKNNVKHWAVKYVQIKPSVFGMNKMRLASICQTQKTKI